MESVEGNGRVKIRVPVLITTIITIIIFAGGVVSSHFAGIATSKDYTDNKVEKVKDEIQQDIGEIKEDVDEVKNKVNQMQIDTAVMKQILVQRFGKPETDG